MQRRRIIEDAEMNYNNQLTSESKEIIEKVKTVPKTSINTAPINTTKPSEVEVKEEVAVTREESRRSSILDDDMEIPTFLRRRR